MGRAAAGTTICKTYKDNMMTELQPDRESDKLIAERLGNQVLCVGKNFGTDEYAIFKGYDRYPLPPYTTDLNAAIELINPDIVIEFRRIFSNLWQVCIPHELDPDENYVGIASGNPALAVCRAWWAWMDREEE